LAIAPKVKSASKNEIRVSYSGFIIFASQILSVLTGLIFTLLLTRNMTKNEFGAWSFIFYLIGLFTLINGLFPFWATRFVARGKEDAVKTAISANFVVAVVATVVYLTFVSGVLGALHVSSIAPAIYLIAALQILNMYLIAVLEACLRSVKPQATGYGLLIEEVVKVVLAFAIFFGSGQLFLGALAGIVVGASVQAVFYTWLLRNYLRQAVHWGYLKEWLKGSAVFVYNVVGGQLLGFVLYLLILFGGESALANYQAAVTFSTVIGYAASLAFALYPKMLAQECPEDVVLSFKNVLMLALPMAAVALTMSTSLLTILNVSYSDASPILILLTVDALVVLVSQFYTQCLMGVETVDAEGKISIRHLLHSKIFKVFTLPYLQAAIALPADYYLLTRMLIADPLQAAVQAAVYVVAVNIVVHAITFVVAYALMHGEFKLIVPWKSVAKYVLASLVAGALLLVLPHTTTLTATFGKALAGVGVYAALLLVIDADARKLGRQITEEIRS
jgi:O-antigen/teichoic acid export membrane protein